MKESIAEFFFVAVGVVGLFAIAHYCVMAGNYLTALIAR